MFLPSNVPCVVPRPSNDLSENAYRRLLCRFSCARACNKPSCMHETCVHVRIPSLNRIRTFQTKIIMHIYIYIYMTRYMQVVSHSAFSGIPDRRDDMLRSSRGYVAGAPTYPSTHWDPWKEATMPEARCAWPQANIMKGIVHECWCAHGHNLNIDTTGYSSWLADSGRKWFRAKEYIYGCSQSDPTRMISWAYVCSSTRD